MSERIDRLLMHPVAGILIFAIVMFGIFEALFAGAEPFMDLIESLTTFLQGVTVAILPAGVLRDLIVEGVIAGVGNVVVFAPQILFLFLFIGFLEDSGYLARVAFVIDRVMKGVGLHGRAFVPLLSGFACAVPAVMATRTIERRRDRLVTMLALPLMSCSARLPVYILVVGTVFSGMSVGWFSAGAVALFSMYALSVLVTLGAAAIMRRTVLKGPTPAFVLEMPPYRWPSARILWLNAWRRLRIFLVDAGTIILAMTIVLWAILSFPKSGQVAERFAAERARIEQMDLPESQEAQALQSLESREAGAQLEQSLGGRLGHAMEPILRPIGFDWQIGVGIIGAFAAREVFVSTLGVVFGIGEADEENKPLRQALRDARHDDGSPVMTPLSGVSLMVFFLLACQCMSTIAVVRKESGSWKWPLFLFSYMTVLAYLGSLLVYQGGRLLGLE
jgi:ferrous iron transport protein B